MTTDTAALAANDQDLAAAAAQVQEIPAAAPPPPSAAPDIPTEREAKLQRELQHALDRLAAFEARRGKEQQLLADRDATLHAIEAAKAKVAAEKKELSEIEAEIAALLKEPLPAPFSETPIGRVIAEAGGTAAAPAPTVQAWADLLPPVEPDSVRFLVGVGDELPTVDQVVGALITRESMAGEKRSLRATQVVECYGRQWMVTHLWQDEETAAARANVVPLYTKDEWQQTHEGAFGRAVQDFDQSEEAKAQRQAGGEFCGLVVKVGRRALVVGPQKDALHLVHDAEPVVVEEDGLELAKRAQEVIAASGMTASAYALQYDLPQVPFLAFLANGELPADDEAAKAIRAAFPPPDADQADRDAPADDDGDEGDEGDEGEDR